MKIKLKAEGWSYIGAMIIALVFIISGAGMPYLKSKLLPIVLGSSILLLAVIGFWRSMRAQAKTEKTSDRVEQAPEITSFSMARRYFFATLWVAGYILGAYLIGLLIATPAFIIIYMKTHGVRWLITVTSAIVLTAFTYLMFELFLEVELFRGILFTLFTQ